MSRVTCRCGTTVPAMTDQPEDGPGGAKVWRLRAHRLGPERSAPLCDVGWVPAARMKYVVLREPWATAVARGIKGPETRAQAPGGPDSPAPRGEGFPGLPLSPGEDLVITAAKRRPTKNELAWWQEVLDEVGPRPKPDDFPLGHAVAVVRYVRAVPASWVKVDETLEPGRWVLGGPNVVCVSPVSYALGNYGEGRWAWLYDDLRPLDPVPVSGLQGIQWLGEGPSALIRDQLDPACVKCGCTDFAACFPPCSWVSLDPPLCSGCAS